MKLLIDNALSPIIDEGLRQAGYDTLHVRSINMQSSTDEEIFNFSEEYDRVIISADTDFGALLAVRKKVKPSFVLIRKYTGTRPDQILELLLTILPKLKDDLEKGSIITVNDEKIRIRYLPIS